jgi:hypothetical protein
VARCNLCARFQHCALQLHPVAADEAHSLSHPCSSDFPSVFRFRGAAVQGIGFLVTCTSVQTYSRASSLVWAIARPAYSTRHKLAPKSRVVNRRPLETAMATSRGFEPQGRARSEILEPVLSCERRTGQCNIRSHEIQTRCRARFGNTIPFSWETRLRFPKKILHSILFIS